ncbi:MAG: ammonium transporter [Bacteroidota bacterium]
MNLKQLLKFVPIGLFLLGMSSVASASETVASSLPSSIIDEQQYNKVIHIMAMLLIGFGFLMVFVRKYGRSALTATFLLVSVAIPIYFFIHSLGIMNESTSEIQSMILSEFAAASLLITAGAVLGRLKMPQYILLGILFVPFYMLNEWILLDNGLGLIAKGAVIDTGGSIGIHAFGAIFGLGVALTMTTKQEFEKVIEADATSDRYSILGSMVLWVFWPSFCAALVTPEQMPHTIVNVIFALCGSTLATYIVSVGLRKKINIADIANATLAGGVAIGSACAVASHTESMIIGILAGAISTFGFAVIQSRQQNWMKLIDTCGVTNLHGIPGLLGGIAVLPILAVSDMKGHMMGILITIILAIVSGYITGKILPIMGRKKEAYEDAEEFMDVED